MARDGEAALVRLLEQARDDPGANARATEAGQEGKVDHLQFGLGPFEYQATGGFPLYDDEVMFGGRVVQLIMGLLRPGLGKEEPAGLSPWPPQSPELRLAS